MLMWTSQTHLDQESGRYYCSYKVSGVCRLYYHKMHSAEMCVGMIDHTMVGLANRLIYIQVVRKANDKTI